MHGVFTSSARAAPHRCEELAAASKKLAARHICTACTAWMRLAAAVAALLAALAILSYLCERVLLRCLRVFFSARRYHSGVVHRRSFVVELA